MNNGVGIAEASAKGFVQRNACDLLSRHRIHQSEMVDIDRETARRLSGAERIGRVEGIGTKLDASTNLREQRRAFQDMHLETLARQSERRSQAPDTPSGDDDRASAQQGPR